MHQIRTILDRQDVVDDVNQRVPANLLASLTERMLPAICPRDPVPLSVVSSISW